MSVVRINVLQVPPERADELAERFARRAREVERAEGFEGFELLRPTDGSDRWFVYTRWASEEAFQRWVDSRGFQQGHARTASDGPVATASELLSFDVVMAVADGGG